MTKVVITAAGKGYKTIAIYKRDAKRNDANVYSKTFHRRIRVVLPLLQYIYEQLVFYEFSRLLFCGRS